MSAGIEDVALRAMAPRICDAREAFEGDDEEAERIGAGVENVPHRAVTPWNHDARRTFDSGDGEGAGRIGIGVVEVQVQCAGPAGGVPPPAKIARWAEAALAGRRSEGAEMTVRAVNEVDGAALNARYRRRTGATNVLAFAFDAPEVPSLRILGDVVVCAPVAAREAREQSKQLDAHWAHLVVHGTLHLLGYDHDEPDAAREMEAIERAILGRLGYPDPYAAEVRP